MLGDNIALDLVRAAIDRGLAHVKIGSGCMLGIVRSTRIFVRARIRDIAIIGRAVMPHRFKRQLGQLLLDFCTFDLEDCPTCKEIEVPSTDISQGFCSFEAGLFAGLVEKITGKHCFAQELECKLQNKSPNCKFMIVIPND